MAGIFVWVSHDFMGEPKPVYWPQVSAIKGIFDAVLLPKDPVAQYAAWWLEDAPPILHVFPHWNWAPGDVIEMWAYTTAAFVELWLNGASLGRQAVPSGGRPWGWNVSWTPGNVTAIGYAADNATAVATASVVTTGAPAALRLTLEAPTAPPGALTADGWDTALVTVAVVDAAGVVVPTAMMEVAFTLDAGAAGVLAGVHDGDPLSHEAHQGGTHAVWMGLARVWLRAGLIPGAITLRASASAAGLVPAVLTIPVLAEAPGSGAKRL